MNRFVFVFMAMLFSFCANAQSENKMDKDSLLADMALRINNIEYQIGAPQRYKLYKTENLYTFLKLDTQTGRIKQLQWSLKIGEEFEIYLNSDDLSNRDSDLGQFELYPTSNMYQFILLDKVNGRTWHVQWGQKSTERWIRRIL